MVPTTYVILSILIGITQLYAARVIPLKSFAVFAFLVVCVFIGVIHYRVFMNGAIGSYDLSSSFTAMFSLAMFLYTCFVPAIRISKRRKAEIHGT